MNIQIITSSYPAFKGDPSGTAGLFVQSFANELISRGHTVVIQPIARKTSYQAEEGQIIEPIPWGGGDQELASMNLFNPVNWFLFLKFFIQGKNHTRRVHQQYKIDRTLCMWVVPCGLFGLWIKKKFGKRYDVWALGSDIWKIRKIPLVGRWLIKKIVTNATGVYADGLQLTEDVKVITQKDCKFLPSNRTLPTPEADLKSLEPSDRVHLLFVGRFHKNKGPDLLMRALSQLSQETKNKIYVHIFGAGPLKDELKNLFNELGLESFSKLNDTIDAQEFSNYLRRVSYLLIPSRIESIPLVFSDALQIGTPAISTPVGDLTNLINNYGCGILSSDISAESFSEAIEQAIAKQKNFFNSNVEEANQQFHISKSAEKWLENNRA